MSSFHPHTTSGHFHDQPCTDEETEAQGELMDKSMGSQPVHSGVRMQSRQSDFRHIQSPHG